MRNQIAAANIGLKRIYEAATPRDGWRVLVDRLWPRGFRKVQANLDAWDKDVAPSPELRAWFGHDPARWPVFRSRYAQELRIKREAVDRLRAEARARPITLVYAAHDSRHTHAIVLREILLGRAIPLIGDEAARMETPDAR